MGGSGVNGEQPGGGDEVIGADGMTDSVRSLAQKNEWNAITQTSDYQGFLGTSPSVSGGYAQKSAAYNAWKVQQDKGQADNKTYVDAVKANPGRQGTLLVPSNATNDPSLLTGNTKKPRTGLL